VCVYVFFFLICIVSVNIDIVSVQYISVVSDALKLALVASLMALAVDISRAARREPRVDFKSTHESRVHERK
jgi:hypothetical protein